MTTASRIRLPMIVAAVSALTALACGCGVGAGEGAHSTPVQVVADMFSGRPDPSWTLTHDETTRLIGCLSGGEIAGPPATPPRGGLGFRRFRVSGLAAPLSYSTASVTAAAVIAEPDSGPRVVTGCAGAYDLLRDSAKAHLSDSDFLAIPERPSR